MPLAKLSRMPEDKVDQAITNWAYAFVCPINQELSTDLVVASDGQIYSRSGWESFVASMAGRRGFKSPVTGKPCSRDAIRCQYLNDHVRQLVGTGRILTNTSYGEFHADVAAELANQQKFAGLKSKAEKGDLHAMVSVARAYMRGEGGSGDASPREALTWWTKAGNFGHVPSALVCAWCHLYGLGTRIDITKAIGIYMQHSTQWSEHLIFSLAHVYNRGIGIAADHAIAFRWYWLLLKRFQIQNVRVNGKRLGDAFMGPTQEDMRHLGVDTVTSTHMREIAQEFVSTYEQNQNAHAGKEAELYFKTQRFACVGDTWAETPVAPPSLTADQKFMVYLSPLEAQRLALMPETAPAVQPERGAKRASPADAGPADAGPAGAGAAKKKARIPSASAVNTALSDAFGSDSDDETIEVV